MNFRLTIFLVEKNAKKAQILAMLKILKFLRDFWNNSKLILSLLFILNMHDILVIEETSEGDDQHREVVCRGKERSSVSVKISHTPDHLLRFEMFSKGIKNAFARTFLPAGYPATVRPEYLAYQFWDSLQGLCSYLRSVLTIQAILKGAGVGNAKASTVASTLAWVMKDGIGMLGTRYHSLK